MGPLILLLAACDRHDDRAARDAVWLLTRASLDLRGVRPSLTDLRAVLATPGSADALIEGYLRDPAFGERYAEMMAGVWLTPVTESDHDQATYPVDDALGMLESLGQEPMRILGRIAGEDLPYTQLVTGDWSVIDGTLAGFFPTDYPADATGWQVVHYTDDRPAAGVLTSNGMWWRYDSTQSNANRGRANAVSRILTCRDYLDIQVEGDRDLNLLDEAAIADALRTNEACVACHAGLDPIAAYFWGFYRHFNFSPAEQSHYHAERETLWEVYSGVGPAWHGEEGLTLEDLGRQIADDPRFVECAAERTLEQLLSRPATLDDTAALTRHREAFLDGGLTLRSLVASVIADPAYRSPPDGSHPRAAGTRLLSAFQLQRSVEDLTGFRFESGGADVFGVDLYGFRSLAGGLGPSWDGEAAVEATPTSVLVQERLAQAAGWSVATADLADPAHARLLVGIGETPDAAIVQDLYLRVLGRILPDDDPEIVRAIGLWSAIHDTTGSPVDAWGGLVAGLLRDPDFVLY